MDTFKTHGAFSWSELMTTDPQAAAEFYGSLFGWAINAMDMGPGGTYRVAKVGETSVGGIMTMPPDATKGAPKMAPMWGCYITVGNVEQSVEKCQLLGGKLLSGPMDVPTVGRMAVLQDPQGATFSVITYSMPAS